MNIKVTHEDNNSIVSFVDLKSKQLDLSTIKTLRNKFKNLSLKNIIIDFHNIEYIDSAVIGFIVELFNEIRNNSGKFSIKNVNITVYEILEMTNLTKFIKIDRT